MSATLHLHPHPNTQSAAALMPQMANTYGDKDVESTIETHPQNTDSREQDQPMAGQLEALRAEFAQALESGNTIQLAKAAKHLHLLRGNNPVHAGGMNEPTGFVGEVWQKSPGRWVHAFTHDGAGFFYAARTGESYRVTIIKTGASDDPTEPTRMERAISPLLEQIAAVLSEGK